MNDQAYSGFFITLEGGEGAGKTTQGRMLAEYLESRGCKVLLTREPGGPPIAEQIRELVLDPGYKGIMHMRTELLLYAAARAQHVAEWILPALLDRQIVISDRFADATIAYQGYGRGFPVDQLQQLHEIATGGLTPELTLLFDLPLEIGFQRVQKRGEEINRLEAEHQDFHECVRKGYLELAAQEPERVWVVDASQEITAMQSQIRERVVQALEAKGLLCSVTS